MWQSAVCWLTTSLLIDWNNFLIIKYDQKCGAFSKQATSLQAVHAHWLTDATLAHSDAEHGFAGESTVWHFWSRWHQLLVCLDKHCSHCLRALGKEERDGQCGWWEGSGTCQRSPTCSTYSPTPYRLMRTSRSGTCQRFWIWLRVMKGECELGELCSVHLSMQNYAMGLVVKYFHTQINDGTNREQHNQCACTETQKQPRRVMCTHARGGWGRPWIRSSLRHKCVHFNLKMQTDKRVYRYSRPIHYA